MRSAGRINFAVVAVTATLFLAIAAFVAAGLMDGYAYAKQETTFAPGTMLLAYTDGVTEAERADHGQYGEQRLLAFASAYAKEAPARFVEDMERDLDAFTAGAEQSDDITALAVRVTFLCTSAAMPTSSFRS